MGAVGLGVTLTELAAVLSDGRLVAKAAAANYLVVPALTVALIWIVAPAPMVAVGFLLLAACPGAPFIPLCARLAKGDVGAATAVMGLLAASSAVLAPLLLLVLLLFVPVSPKEVDVDGLKLATTLFLTQLLPLGMGLAVRRWLPRLAARVHPAAAALSKL